MSNSPARCSSTANILAETLAKTAVPEPEDLLRLCGRFRVNVRPLIIAAGELLAETPYCLLLSRWRGHRQRDWELDFRVDGTAGARHAYLPVDQRLVSVGLDGLVTAMAAASHGEQLAGTDSKVEIGLRRLRGERSSATLRGEVSWQAIRQGNETPFLLAVLDLTKLAAQLRLGLCPDLPEGVSREPPAWLRAGARPLPAAA